MKEKNIILREMGGWIISIVAGFFIATLVNSQVFAKVQVQQMSMENTLHAKQHLIVDKLSYNFSQPKRGDIIIFLENDEKRTIVHDVLDSMNNIKALFISEDNSSRLIKRVIGIPGDEIDIKDGCVYVNGEKLNESYAKGETFDNGFEFPIEVPDNKLFVLGDNRPVSKDSRQLGFINYNQVECKAILRVYPFDKMGVIK